jgi:Sulfotransferase family
VLVKQSRLWRLGCLVHLQDRPVEHTARRKNAGGNLSVPEGLARQPALGYPTPGAGTGNVGAPKGMSPSAPTFIHVGFTNTGTTSLQLNFFATRSDIFFGGEPYGERGGIFTAIKSVEDFKFDAANIGELCKELIYAQADGRPVVLSDENLCDTPQLHFGPYAIPRDAIARRLHHFFPSAKIIFTIRDQRQYAMSAYFNIKNNTAFFDHMPMAPFPAWLDAMLSRDRPYFMQNLNFLEIISFYEVLFGRENILVLPLEMLVIDGIEPYLRKLCDFIGVPFSDADVANYAKIQNRRMSQRRELVAELLHDNRFSRLFADLGALVSKDQLEAFLDDGPRAAVTLQPADDDKIRHRVGTGNWLLAREFDLDLARYGYPMARDEDFSRRQLDAARQEMAYRNDIHRLRGQVNGEEFLACRVAAELARLRELAMELMTVRQSPVWRTVERLDRMRRLLRRA